MGYTKNKDLITGGVFITAIVIMLGLNVMVKNTPVQEGTEAVIASTFQAQDEDCE